jgi:EAL domain-containing protein (putative c-di-GMP-specific phosphodiesterase class I)
MDLRCTSRHVDACPRNQSSPVRFFASAKPLPEPERLLWSRDIRFGHRLARAIHGARVLELDSGVVVIAPARLLSDASAAEAARAARDPEYGIVPVDANLDERDRYLVALSAAVQQSGIAERIGMGQSMQVVQTKTLDYFFSRRDHEIEFQPIVELATGRAIEYECLSRPVLPGMPTSISTIVQAAIDTGRSVELDVFLTERILLAAGRLQARRVEGGEPPLGFAINLTPASLLDDQFAAPELAQAVRAAGLTPRQITLECTEQQAVSDVLPLQRQVKDLRKLGFGFAVDDAGAGYASFALIAALRPTVIKIDREIVRRIATDDAKQALVEAFVSFGRRIRAKLLAEGIETRRDLTMLTTLGVELGQGFLLGKPTAEPVDPRKLDPLVRRATARRARTAAGVSAARAH